MDGTITCSASVPRKAAARYITYYTIRTDDGRILTYTAGSTDACLDNGRWIAFPTLFYGTILLGALWLLLSGLVKYRDASCHRANP